MAKKEKKYGGRSGAAARLSGRNIDRPDIQARKSAARSMQRAGVQSLSGLSGSQGQVARFKSEQNKLRREYRDKNTSDERKEEIIKDLRGVSRDLNEQSRAAALNQVIEEFGPGSVLPGGGIMGSDAGARFQQLRGNPNFYQDGRPGLETFVGNQGAFKTGDKNLFKQVNPNPLLKLLGSAAQITNLTPTGIIRNLNKIKKGEPLIDLDFMKRNTSESPSRLKNFYNAYMDSVNKEIQKERNKEFDAVPLDPQFQNIGGEKMDITSPKGDPTRVQDDKDIQDEMEDEMERNLINQYSLLGQDDLATSLLDDTEETELEEAINPDVDATAAYEQEFMQTYGPGSDLFQKEIDDGINAGFKDFDFEGKNYDQLSGSDREYIRKIIQLSGGSLPYDASAKMPLNILDRFGTDGGTDFNMFQDSPFETDNIPADAFSDVRSSVLPKAASIIPQTFKDGGSVSTYDVLKLINDTMNDG